MERPAALLADRAGPVVRTRDGTGAWSGESHRIGLTGSMLSEFADPRAAPELLMLRERIRSWRCYDAADDPRCRWPGRLDRPSWHWPKR
ncbi:hypothetical protein [Amycolatopsis saalfeldensis]|uniref:Uncharacterized protein n=1 Tax=Amycolatopsis saalfeldensis TaxID=394193 RepID=A0A1H8Y5V6_9PSEU|nr:hypothetical protein [Amycolatopsis saalfeldensis]SEP47644.1 hypothetical protein SAMN04489732_111177 [Amycolatopsis saalfeldensis]